jgi:hypothetical protein
MPLDDPPTDSERSRALQNLTSVRPRARRRRLGALAAGGAVAAAVAIALPLGLAGSTKSHNVHVLGTPPSSAASTTTSTAPAGNATEPTSTTPSTSPESQPYPRETLGPATVPPVSDECSLALTHDADGNVTPRLCPNGGVNVLAWKYYANGDSQTLALGREATTNQVVQAMCHDYVWHYGTNPLTISLQQLAAAYYGWAFPTDPATVFQRQGCASAYLKVTLTSNPDPVTPGHTLVFAVSVTNISSTTLIGLTARLPLPQYVQSTSWSPTCRGQGPTFVCSISSSSGSTSPATNSQLGPGQTRTDEITTTVDTSPTVSSFSATVTVTGTAGYSGGPSVTLSASATTAES